MLESFLEKSDYAEDQKNAQLILYTHVIVKTMPVCGVLGCALGAVTGLLRKGRPIRRLAVQGTSIGWLSGSAVGAMATWGRMRGREEIEWKDRAWRLQRNMGQQKMDMFLLGGTALGAVWGLSSTAGLLAGASIGSIPGFVVGMAQKKIAKSKSA